MEIPAGMDRAQVAQWINNQRFTPVRFRGGYDMGDVDDLLDQLSAVITSGGDPRPVAQQARFTVVRFREGYETDDVDDLLECLAALPPDYFA